MPELPSTDSERIATALRFYLDRVKWLPTDDERAEFERLLAATERAETAAEILDTPATGC